MKINKTFGRVATTFLATAMLASVTAVPAFATEGQFKGNTFSVQKHLTLQENTNAPAKVFTFNVAVASASNQPLTQDEQSKGIEYGVADAIEASKTATIQANTTATNGVVSVASENFTVDITKFQHAGVYKYVVTESSVDNDDFKYDNNQLILYVHIKNDSAAATGLSVELVELVDPDGDKTDSNAPKAAKIDGFTNEYGKDNSNNDKLHDIILNKVVTGDQADLNATFKFMVGVDSEYDNNTVLIIDTNGDGTYGNTVEGVADEVKTLPADGTGVEIELSNNVSAMICNLTDGSTYTVREVAGGRNGYVTTVDDEHNFTDSTNYTVTGNGSADDEITYTNTKTSVTPTGLAMDIAPYALLVVVAAAGCFVFLRKRNDD